jgi:hypothetical protein
VEAAKYSVLSFSSPSLLLLFYSTLNNNKSCHVFLIDSSSLVINSFSLVFSLLLVIFSVKLLHKIVRTAITFSQLCKRCKCSVVVGGIVNVEHPNEWLDTIVGDGTPKVLRLVDTTVGALEPMQGEQNCV